MGSRRCCCSWRRRRSWRRPPWPGRATRPPTRSSARTPRPATRRCEWDVEGAGDPSIQGFRHRHQRRPGRDGPLQDQRPTRTHTTSTSTGWATTAATARARSTTSSRRRPCRRTSRLPDRRRDRARRLRQLGGVRLLGGPGRRRLRHLLRQAVRDDEPAGGKPHRLRRPRRRRHVGHPLPDLRHDLAGLQQVRRQQPLRGRPRDRARTRLQGQLQPAVHDPGHRRPRTAFFNAEYPMVRWLERNGYDVSYFTGVDTDRRGARDPRTTRCSCRSATTSTGPAAQRANVEAARDAGVNLAFFSGNEVFWKTRWENSIDGSSTDYRTLVSYKETHANAKIDPGRADVWTGTWRDPRFSPPADGGRPENALTGTIFMVNSGTAAIQVPGRRRQAAVLAQHQRRHLRRRARPPPWATGTLGYEWDEDLDNGFRPAGLVDLSSTTVRRRRRYLQDYGSTYGAGHRDPPPDPLPGARAGRSSSARAPSSGPGASTATTTAAARPPTRACSRRRSTCSPTWAPSRRRCSRPGRRDRSSTDTVAADGDDHLAGRRRAASTAGMPITITGTATDTRRRRSGRRASRSRPTAAPPGIRPTGRDNWSYTWTPGAAGSADDQGAGHRRQRQPRGPGDRVDGRTSAPAPALLDLGRLVHRARATTTPNAIELGVKFRSDVSRLHHRPPVLQGRRQHRHARRPPVDRRRHPAGRGDLQRRDRLRLAAGRASTSPVAIDAEHDLRRVLLRARTATTPPPTTTSPPAASTAPRCTRSATGSTGRNGVYDYGPSGGLFPARPGHLPVEQLLGRRRLRQHDVGPDTTPPTITARSPAGGATDVSTGRQRHRRPSASRWTRPRSTAPTSSCGIPRTRSSPATVTYNAATAKGDPRPRTAPLQNSTTYTATVKGGAGGVTDDASPANALAADSTWSFTTAAPPPPPPDEGPGGPILVISNAANPFSRYFAEILRAEGLNEFTATDISNVTPAVLNAHDVAILGDGPLTAAQAADAERLGAGGRQPDRDAARPAARRPARPDARRRHLWPTTT